MAGTIIATEAMKPSPPTPLAPKNHKLSFLDQMIPPSVYLSLVFFYKNDESKQHEEISRRLKQSLSEILTLYYPLAGIIKQNSFVECNNTRGVEMVEALVHAPLSQFTENPKIEELEQLVSFDLLSCDENLLTLKTSFFDCGGVSIGVCLSHKIADMASLSNFMNAWAATCRGEEASSPSLDMALHFPPRDVPFDSLQTLETPKEEMTAKRLVFDRDEIEKQREEASSDEVKNPSRVEAVSAFIWRNLIEASKRSTTTTTSFAISHAVNLRQRVVPPISDITFGNCTALATAVISSEEDEGGIKVLVSKLRKAIRQVDDDYIKKVVKCKDITQIFQSENGLSRQRHFFFTSWIRFPLYKVDFGWGKPVRVCNGILPYINMDAVILMTTPSGDGIEALIRVHADQFPEL